MMESRTARIALTVGLVAALVAVVGVASAAQLVADYSEGDHPMSQHSADHQTNQNHGDTHMTQNYNDHTDGEQSSQRTNNDHSDHAHGSCGR